ncbi:MAG: hypothetical protein QM817_15670 [Archangium sp.]
MVRHDALHALLLELRASLEQRDAEGAEALMSKTAEAVMSTPDAAADERVMPLLKHCDALANAYHRELFTAMQHTGAGNRAARTYEAAGDAG